MNNFTGAILTAAVALAPAAAYANGPSGTQRYIEVRGAKLYVQIYGHGAPIVFLHGGMLFFDNNFVKQRDYFATYRTVVGIDQRGYGHSPDGPWPLSYQMMADDTAAVVEQLGLGPVDVVGHSDGANLALILARDHPQMVRCLVISGANIRVALSPEEKQRAQWSPQQLAGHLREVANSLPPWFLPDYSRVSPDGPEHWMTLLAKSYDMWLQPVVIEPADLKKISIPVLVMAATTTSPPSKKMPKYSEVCRMGNSSLCQRATTERSTSGRGWSISQYASFWTNPIMVPHYTSPVANRSTLRGRRPRLSEVYRRLNIAGQKIATSRKPSLVWRDPTRTGRISKDAH
jgi:pimeloyl-ACP methyl ester carboxylesterase